MWFNFRLFWSTVIVRSHLSSLLIKELSYKIRKMSCLARLWFWLYWKSCSDFEQGTSTRSLKNLNESHFVSPMICNCLAHKNDFCPTLSEADFHAASGLYSLFCFCIFRLKNQNKPLKPSLCERTQISKNEEICTGSLDMYGPFY